jgi:hypothetical protein
MARVTNQANIESFINGKKFIKRTSPKFRSLDYLRDPFIVGVMKKKYGEGWKKYIKQKIKSVHGNGEDQYSFKSHLANVITNHTEDNKVAFVCGGVDCDGGMWDNRVSLISSPTVSKLDKAIESYYIGAEGHQWHRFMSPSKASELNQLNRDLAMEAHEDGHGHSIRI